MLEERREKERRKVERMEGTYTGDRRVGEGSLAPRLFLVVMQVCLFYTGHPLLIMIRNKVHMRQEGGIKKEKGTKISSCKDGEWLTMQALETILALARK